MAFLSKFNPQFSIGPSLGLKPNSGIKWSVFKIVFSCVFAFINSTPSKLVEPFMDKILVFKNKGN